MQLRLKIAGLFASFISFLLLSAWMPAENRLLTMLLDGLVFGSVALILILIPKVRQVSGWFVMGGGVLLLGAFKFLGSDGVFADDVAFYGMFMFEVLFLLVIARLAYDISVELQVLQTGEGVLGLAVELLPDLESDVGKSIVKREMMRCRQEERPLSIILFNPFPSPAVEAERLLSEIPLGLQEAYQKSRIAESIRRHLILPHILLLDVHQERFLVLCPETTTNDARQLAVTLGQKLIDDFGFQPMCAVTTFPDDGLTFNKLLDLAKVSLEEASKGHKVESALVCN